MKEDKSKIPYVWEVHTRIPDPNKPETEIPCQMSVVADHIDKVWNYIATDRADKNVEIVAIVRREPIVAML